MKTMIFPVAGLLVGLLGGTAYGGLKEKNVLLAEKAAAEAQAAEEAGATDDHEGESLSGHEDDQASGHVEDGGEVGSVPSEDQTPMADDPTSHGEEASPTDEQETLDTAAGVVEPTPVATEITLASDPADLPPGEGPTPPAASPQQPQGSGFLSEQSGGPERMAKIFGAMKPPDAAKVLQNLDDLEVRAILSFLSDRKAAEILGNFEPERAAALSRLVLGSPGGGAR
jgi:hypothetical protein